MLTRAQDAQAAEPATGPAIVTLIQGLLKVEANGSDLANILRQVADLGGMQIDGSVRSARIYGTYGPQDPLDVLTALLAGSGYNFAMVGITGTGLPGRLLLTLKQGGVTPPSKPSAVASVPQEPSPGPGAITNVPPPPSEDPQERMQQNLQRLQQMQLERQQPQQPQ